MSDSNRRKIIDAVFAMIDTWDNVESIEDVCADPAESAVAATLEAGQIHADVRIHDDEVNDEEGQGQGWNVTAAQFQVTVLLTFPLALVGAGGTTRPSDVGEAIYADAKKKIFADGQGGTWSNLAMRTQMLGGGGVSFADDSGATLMTSVAFLIKHRHPLGNPDNPM